MSKPKLFFMCGIPGAGKSTWLENHEDELDFVIHSSDAIREEFGDVNDQSKNNDVFSILHRRVKEDLLNRKNVAYDSTGLKRKNRLHFLKEIEHIPCEKICMLFATPIEICKKNNANRERKVPEEVIDRMVKSFEVPCYCAEKWDKIQIVWWDWKKDGMEFDFYKDLESWRSISHNNPHHRLSIGDHMIEASNHYSSMCEYYEDWNTEDRLLSMAILMHDCGKLFCREFKDSKGNPCEHAHYYEHHNAGSLISLFYLKDLFEDESMRFTDDEILHISLLINLHMRHFLAYKNSDKAREKDRRLFGDEILAELDVLRECDLASH